jgi:hypothetical protein
MYQWSSAPREERLEEWIRDENLKAVSARKQNREIKSELQKALGSEFGLEALLSQQWEVVARLRPDYDSEVKVSGLGRARRHRVQGNTVKQKLHCAGSGG